MKLDKIGLIGRFKPLHNGAALMLDAALSNANEVIIGIGSSNKYNLRNPFTSIETEEMLNTYLSKKHNNYKIILVPDFGHIPEYKDGQKWRSYVKENFGNLDAFVTANEYVESLLREDYKIIHSWELIPRENWLELRATMVRIKMASGDSWKSFIPIEVSEYLEKNNLVERFRKEFGLQTLAELSTTNYEKHENAIEEKLHAGEF